MPLNCRDLEGNTVLHAVAHLPLRGLMIQARAPRRRPERAPAEARAQYLLEEVNGLPLLAATNKLKARPAALRPLSRAEHGVLLRVQETAAHIAARSRNWGVLKQLIAAGASVSVKDGKLRTVFQYTQVGPQGKEASSAPRPAPAAGPRWPRGRLTARQALAEGLRAKRESAEAAAERATRVGVYIQEKWNPLAYEPLRPQHRMRSATRRKRSE